MALSTLLMFSVLPLVWFKKVWDFIKPLNDHDASLTVPPRNAIAKALYKCSFYIMSKAIWRTAIYLLVVSILVVVSLLHLVSRIN
jgi:hypothetical protein